MEDISEKQKAENFAKAILALIDARTELKDAKDRVPRYTGQYSPKDYYQVESINYDRAVAKLYDAVMCINKG